jgi:lycopene cyclase domain-containing protein
VAGLYLLLLVSTLGCLGLIDHRYQLVFFCNWRRALAVFAWGLPFFIVWDVAGIWLGIFFTGTTPYLTGVRLAPNFPVEEILFLCVLLYTPLIISQYYGTRKQP